MSATKCTNWAQTERNLRSISALNERKNCVSDRAQILRSVALNLRKISAKRHNFLQFCALNGLSFALCCALSEKHDKSTILAQQSANWAQNGRKVSAISPLLRSVVLILRSCHVFRATERKLRLNKRSTKCVPFALLAQNKRKISATDRNRAQSEPKVRAKWIQFALCCAICAQFAL